MSPAPPSQVPAEATETTLFTGIHELYTPFVRVPDAALAVLGGTVRWCGPLDALPAPLRAAPRVDLGGRAVLPGLVDAHTHLVWAGSRVEDHRRRAAGERYEDILAAGGGIHATVRATVATEDDALLALAQGRAATFLAGGVTTLEVKSGYGLTVAGELRLLEVVRRLGRSVPQRIVPTLLVHLPAPGRERRRALEGVIEELLPEVHHRALAEAVDVFIDEGAFTLAEGRRLLEAARSLGLPIKAHAEQLGHTGAARLVAELGGLSADHLERARPDDLEALARAGSVATLLPGAALLLGGRLPSAAMLRASGVRVAIASDHNPGSSPLYGLLPALRLAAPMTGLSLEEVLVAGTAHAADALARPRLGRLQEGAPADFVVVDGTEALLPLVAWGTTSIRDRYIGGVRTGAPDIRPRG